MNHDDVALAALLEGDLSETQAAAWDEHLLGCDTCWTALGEARRGRVLAASLREPAPVALSERVEVAVGVAARSGPRGPRRRVRQVVAVTTVILVLAAGALFAVERRDDGVQDAEPIAVVLRLAADGDEAAPPVGKGIVITRLHVNGRDVVLARADRPFPMPEGAIALADDPQSPWLARRGEVSLLCFSHPAPMLLAGRASPDTLTAVAAALGIDPSPGRNQTGAPGVPLG